MAKTETHQHHSWLLIIVILLVILALGLSLVFGLFNRSGEEQSIVAPKTPTPTLGQSDQIETIEKDLEATTINDLEEELDQIEDIFNQL